MVDGVGGGGGGTFKVLHCVVLHCVVLHCAMLQLTLDTAGSTCSAVQREHIQGVGMLAEQEGLPGQLR